MVFLRDRHRRAAAAQLVPHQLDPDLADRLWTRDHRLAGGRRQKGYAMVGAAVPVDRAAPLLLDDDDQRRLSGRGGRQMELGVEGARRSEEPTSELQSLMRLSYAVICLYRRKKKHIIYKHKSK